ncbi:heparanase isoform X4 [Cygnus atratus]|uniref:heparanase isoform X4 n=1 Tax=Cygnus atratus TaxID=8868 RepID=UPI0021B7EA76|nr:heparanase isoform X4 [Cygnus atratus]
MLAPLLLLLLAVPLWQAAELRLGLRGSPRGTVSPAFLSLTLDASLAREPRFITLLRCLWSTAWLRCGAGAAARPVARPGEVAPHRAFPEEAQKHHHYRAHAGHPPWLRQLLRLPPGVRAQCPAAAAWPGVGQLQRWAAAGLLRPARLQPLLGAGQCFKKKSGIYIDGSQLGRDFIHLRRLLSQHPLYRHAKLYGPDVGQPRKHTQRLLRSFLKSGGKVIDSVTWHHYYVDGRSATREDFLSPTVLDTFATAVRDVLEIVAATVPGKKVWLGETSSAYGGGAPQLSNTYLAGFMWLDKLGLAARQGIDVVMRQVFFGAGSYHLVDASFEPLPDYWLSLLYKRLVGTRVLEASVAGADARRLRVYLHCTNPQHPKYREGDVTLFALNLYNVSQNLQLPKQLWSKRVDQYLLLPHGKESILSRRVQLNGRLLQMVDKETLPTLHEAALAPGSALGLPAFSYGFYVIRNAKAIACI